MCGRQVNYEAVGWGFPTLHPEAHLGPRDRRKRRQRIVRQLLGHQCLWSHWTRRTFSQTWLQLPLHHAAPRKGLSYASWARGPCGWKDEGLAPKGICLLLLEGELPRWAGKMSCSPIHPQCLEE